MNRSIVLLAISIVMVVVCCFAYFYFYNADSDKKFRNDIGERCIISPNEAPDSTVCTVLSVDDFCSQDNAEKVALDLYEKYCK